MTDDNSTSTANQKPLPDNAPTVADANAAKTDANETSTNAPDVQMKKVDIVITGVTYSVLCPIDEQKKLQEAVAYINSFARDIRKDAPNLSQEKLLLLFCLNLYEEISTYKNANIKYLSDGRQSEVLLSKILKDAQSIL